MEPETMLQWTSYLGLALIGFCIVVAILVLKTNISRKMAGRLTIIGLSCLALTSAITSINYIWHHFYR